MEFNFGEFFKDKKKIVYLGAGFGVAAIIGIYFVFWGYSSDIQSGALQEKDITPKQKAVSEVDRLSKKLENDFLAVPENYYDYLRANEGIPVIVSEIELFVKNPFLVFSATDTEAQEILLLEPAEEPIIEEITEPKPLTE